MSEEEGGFARQARALTDRNFERQRQDLKRLQAHEMKARQDARAREVRSFADNRDRAVADHRRHIDRIDQGERQALQAFQARRSSLRGRLVGLVRGQAHYARQEAAIRQRFEAQRLTKHVQLERIQARQHQAERQARERHDREHGAAVKRHAQDRDELLGWQDKARERQVKDHTRALAEQQLRQALRQEQERERPQEHGLARAWSRTA